MHIMSRSSTRIRVLSLFLVIAIGFSQGANASPTKSSNNVFQRRQNTTEEAEPLNCTTEFSSDYYGFGVRLGVYFAWLTSYFANTMLASEIAGSLDTNCIFLVTLLISLFRGTIKHQLYQIDGLIVMHLASGFLFSSLSIWGYRTVVYQTDGAKGIRKFGGWGTHGRLALITAISIYGTWFWWEGTEDGLIIAQDPRCRQLYTWLFHTWKLGGGINKYYIIVCFGCSIYFGCMCAAAVLAYTFKITTRGFAPEVRMETGLRPLELKILFNVFRIFNLSWIIFCAAMIEMTINSNHMVDLLAHNGSVASPAQLIPLLVGVLGFARVIWLILKDWRKSLRKRSDERIGWITKLPEFVISFLATDHLHSHADVNEPPVKTYHARYVLSWMPWLAELFRHGKQISDIEVAATDTKGIKFTKVSQEEVKDTI